MSVVLDTSVVVALLDADDAHHEAAAAWVATSDEDLVTTPLALAEMDFFAQRLGGPSVMEQLWADFADGVYDVRWWADGLVQTIDVARQHPPLGLTDASLVALAARVRTTRIATLDQRHFRAVASADGRPFTLLPADHEPPVGPPPT